MRVKNGGLDSVCGVGSAATTERRRQDVRDAAVSRWDALSGG